MSKQKQRYQGEKQAQFEVTVDIPGGVSIEQMRLYIKEAVGVWCRSGDPDDPLFWLNARSIKVRYILQSVRRQQVFPPEKPTGPGRGGKK